MDIFSFDLLLYPINLGSHWCLAAIHTTRKTLSYYDSLGGRGRSCLETLRQYLVSEHRDKRKTEISLEGWRDIDPGVRSLSLSLSLSGNSSLCFAGYASPEEQLRLWSIHMHGESSWLEYTTHTFCIYTHSMLATWQATLHSPSHR